MPDSGEGIVVVASLELLRKAVEKVLFEFVESCEAVGGSTRSPVDYVDIGDTVVFKEDMDLMPAEIVAVKIGEDQWYVMSTTELPATGFPTTKDAMRVAAAEAKKLHIMKDFLAKEVGNYIIKEVEEWVPDKREEADKLRAVIENAANRWLH
jgi:hypothetical protein